MVYLIMCMPYEGVVVKSMHILLIFYIALFHRLMFILLPLNNLYRTWPYKRVKQKTLYQHVSNDSHSQKI